jgi:hypothetical protein
MVERDGDGIKLHSIIIYNYGGAAKIVMVDSGDEMNLK